MKLEIATTTDLSEERKIKVGVSDVKRFYERWKADLSFRQQMSLAPDLAIAKYQLNVDPEEVRPIWDADFSEKHQQGMPIADSLNNFKQLVLESDAKTRTIHLLNVRDRRFDAWRQRQIARCKSEFHPEQHGRIVHATMTFELSKGCSVGCWFCGISAERVGGVFDYSPENAKLWREILVLMKDIIGETGAGSGFCYWGTDPLDNPDYDRFCLDFHDIVGKFPQMTTAQPLKYPDRVRALLEIAKHRDGFDSRFSVLSLKMLDRIHEEFTAEELAFVQLVLQNPEAGEIKSNSGRTRERNQQQQDADDRSIQSTIACVSGFLFNMVDRTVQLISPCNAGDRWKDGYIIYDSGTFTDLDDLQVLLEAMIEKNMLLSVQDNHRIRFRYDLKYTNIDGGFQLASRWLTSKFRNEPYLSELGEIVRTGDRTAGEISQIFEKQGISKFNTFHTLNSLFNKGMLDEFYLINDISI
jgi:radical SAM family RiPP maturation amino acid epimerase